MAAHYRIEQLPLALLMKIASPDAPLRVEGTIGGNGDIKRDAAGAFNGQATLGSDKGSVAYPDNASQPLIAYTNLAVNANLAPQTIHATVKASLDHDGKIDGELGLNGPPHSAQALSGRLDATLNSLGFVELLTPEVANTKGRVEAHYTFAGTTAAPQLGGALSLKEFATEVPTAGLKLHDGEINVRSSDSGTFRHRRHAEIGRRHADGRRLRRHRQDRAGENHDQGRQLPRRRHSRRESRDLARPQDRAQHR